MTVIVPSGMTVHTSHATEHRVRDAILNARREVKEVRIHVHAEDEVDGGARTGKTGEDQHMSDFGRDAR